MIKKNITFLLAGGKVNCLKYGNGKPILIALHGFAQTGEFFDAIAKIWRDRFVIYAPDLPFHGNTHWTKKKFTAVDVQEFISLILQKEKKTSYHLLGFSLGGRIILSTLDQLVPHPKSITLIAPDGLATRRMFLPNMIPNFLKRNIFKSDRRALFIKNLAHFLHKTRWIDSFSLRYINYHFKNDSRRKRLLNTWLLLSFFRVSPKKVIPFLEKTNIPVALFLSKKDEYISSKEVLNFTQKSPSIQFFEYDGNHRLDDKNLLTKLSSVYSHLEPH